MGRKRRNSSSSRSMKLALSILFLAGISAGAPTLAGIGLARDMNTGHSPDTLARHRKQTAIKITKEVLPKIEHNFKMLKLITEREHNETSQLYKYIDASIAHATKAIIKTIIDLKTNTDESIKALEENTKENLVSLKTINNENNQKILETTVNSNNSALALSLDWLSRRMDAAEDILTSRVGVCGVSPKRREAGVVNYDRILHHTEGDKKMRLAGKDLSVGDVFDKTRGLFTVPLGGSGEYSISVGVVMKVYDWQFSWGTPQNVLSQYVLYVGNRPLKEAILASDNGASENADIVQASRTISLHLTEGQVVLLEKSDSRDSHAPHASSDFYITFCVSLKHLDKAFYLDATPEARPSSPSVELSPWTFDAPSLNTIAPPPAEIETISPPSRPPILDVETTIAPSHTPPPCLASGFHNCD